MADGSPDLELPGLVAGIVAAHASNNAASAAEISYSIRLVYAALSMTGTTPVVESRPEPVVPIKKSVFPDYLVCLEDGKKLKMLKRHLPATYNLTPEAYRARWNLPATYPMVAPNYASHCSTIARSSGLGRRVEPAAGGTGTAHPGGQEG